MVQRIDINTLYGEKIPNQSYMKIDELIATYQDPDVDHIQKATAMADLLKSFHNYFMKYVRLLKGELNLYNPSIRNSDTIEFLALFNSSKDKRTGDWPAQTYQSIARIYQNIEEEDIYNELCLQFLELLSSYKVYEGTSFARYITKYLRWSIKAWVLEVSKALEKSRNPIGNNMKYIEENLYAERSWVQSNTIDLPEMTVQWILSPQTKLFQILSSYERFLLYLSYKEELGLRQIGEKLGRTKDTIRAHLTEAIEKLRHEYNNENKEGD